MEVNYILKMGANKNEIITKAIRLWKNTQNNICVTVESFSSGCTGGRFEWNTGQV